jgi:hypothetical protein
VSFDKRFVLVDIDLEAVIKIVCGMDAAVELIGIY